MKKGIAKRRLARVRIACRLIKLILGVAIVLVLALLANHLRAR